MSAQYDVCHDSKLYEYCKNGDIKAVNSLIKIGLKNYNYGFEGACAGGHMVLIQMMLSLGANSYGKGLVDACKDNNNMHVIKFLLSKYKIEISYINSGLSIASRYGYMDIALVLLSNGAYCFNAAAHNACTYGYNELLLLLLKRGAKDYQNLLVVASKNNNLPAVKLMIEKGARNYADAFVAASENGYVDILKYLSTFTRKKHCFALSKACKNGHVEAVKFILSRNIRYDEGQIRVFLYQSIDGQNLEIFKNIFKMVNRVSLVEDAMRCACNETYGPINYKIIKHILGYGGHIEMRHYFNYINRPQVVLSLLDNGVYIECLKTIDGYFAMVTEISTYRYVRMTLLNQLLLPPIANIINGYICTI